jgi:hypothetical protein
MTEPLSQKPQRGKLLHAAVSGCFQKKAQAGAKNLFLFAKLPIIAKCYFQIL